MSHGHKSDVCHFICSLNISCCSSELDVIHVGITDCSYIWRTMFLWGRVFFLSFFLFWKCSACDTLLLSCRPLGLARAETIYIHNPSQEVPVTLLSMFTTSRHFYIPFSHRRVSANACRLILSLFFFFTQTCWTNETSVFVARWFHPEGRHLLNLSSSRLRRATLKTHYL